MLANPNQYARNYYNYARYRYSKYPYCFYLDMLYHDHAAEWNRCRSYSIMEGIGQFLGILYRMSLFILVVTIFVNSSTCSSKSQVNTMICY
jgi:hypothetical protein